MKMEMNLGLGKMEMDLDLGQWGIDNQESEIEEASHLDCKDCPK